MAKASRRRDYIFQRPGSSNWYVKLRSPGEKRKEVSLGTPDRAQAEILALPRWSRSTRRALLADSPATCNGRGQHQAPAALV